MSEEKKASWGKSYDANAPQETKQAAAPTTDAAAAAPVPDIPTDQEDGGDPDVRRGRNQHVLPGILGKQLRAAYGELLNAPVPDAIAELIKRLENAEPGQKLPKSRDEENSQ
jgi:hypothetical protein